MGILVTPDQEIFLEYCKNVYRLFFADTDQLVISNERFVDILCQTEAVEEEPLKALVKFIDEDESANISFTEVVSQFIAIVKPVFFEKDPKDPHGLKKKVEDPVDYICRAFAEHDEKFEKKWKNYHVVHSYHQ
jgi:hypothetical protein